MQTRDSFVFGHFSRSGPFIDLMETIYFASLLTSCVGFLKF